MKSDHWLAGWPLFYVYVTTTNNKQKMIIYDPQEKKISMSNMFILCSTTAKNKTKRKKLAIFNGYYIFFKNETNLEMNIPWNHGMFTQNTIIIIIIKNQESRIKYREY